MTRLRARSSAAQGEFRIKHKSPRGAGLSLTRCQSTWKSSTQKKWAEVAPASLEVAVPGRVTQKKIKEARCSKEKETGSQFNLPGFAFTVLTRTMMTWYPPLAWRNPTFPWHSQNPYKRIATNCLLWLFLCKATNGIFLIFYFL